VVHTAAFADIDYCQNNQADALRVNVEVTRALAQLCADAGAKMIVCSTDTVFDGGRPLYGRRCSARGHFYAEPKIKAESIVRETVPNGVVARCRW